MIEGMAGMHKNINEAALLDHTRSIEAIDKRIAKKIAKKEVDPNGVSQHDSGAKLDSGTLRTFDTGATRDTAEGKLDYEGFLSPLVLERYAEYMNSNRKQSDGNLRDSDNWQKGIPKIAYIKSGYRHFFDWWKEHRGYRTKDGMEVALCGLIFNAMGYLHEFIKERIDWENSEEAERRGG